MIVKRKIETSFSLNEADLEWIKGDHGFNELKYNYLEKYYKPSDDFQARFKTFLSKFDAVIDGDKLQKELFPNDDLYDIFISHAHADMDDDVDIKLQYLFDQLDLNCFIDGLLWQSSRDALNTLNIKHSDCEEYSDGNVFSHEKCNKASEHINTLLALTLSQAINRSKVVMFINTPQSLSAKEYMSKENKTNNDATFSPWINYELQMINLLPQTHFPPVRVQFSQTVNIKDQAMTEDLKISYRVKTPSHLRSSFANIYKQCIYEVLKGNDALNKILDYKAN